MTVAYFLIEIITGFYSCKGDLQKNQAKSLEAIPVEKGSNASLINNPVSADGKADTTNVAKIKFEEESFNFGTIKQGKVVNHTFKFTNNGKVPLLIKECSSSCGCTIPTYPKEPIEPGKSSQIEVKFDSKGKEGNIRKTVTVYANTLPNDTKIVIEGTVNK